jgi:thiol-disulfide isomerase/thioredoxin
MMPMIIERILASIVFIAGFAILVKSFGFLRQWRAQTSSIAHRLPAGLKSEEPSLLYFWSNGCAQCKPQERQIEQAKETLLQTGQKFSVVKVNALEEQQLASLMHVMTVPTTVLLDSHGNISALNPGLTPWRTLVEQFRSVR